MVDMDVWGPALWKAFHTVALGYSALPEERPSYKEFYAGFGRVLPCQTCRQHYAKHFALMNIDRSLGSRGALFAWTVAMHNAVNAAKGRAEVSVQDAYDMLLKDSNDSLGLILVLMIGILIGGSMGALWLRGNKL